MDIHNVCSIKLDESAALAYNSGLVYFIVFDKYVANNFDHMIRSFDELF